MSPRSTSARTTLRSRSLAHLTAICSTVLLLLIAPLVATPVSGQEVRPEDALEVTRLVVEPQHLQVAVGERVPLTVRALDTDGNELNPPIFIQGARNGVEAVDGELLGIGVGEYRVMVAVIPPEGSDMEPPVAVITVEVTWPSIAEVRVEPREGRLFSGTHVRFTAKGLHADGSERAYPEIEWRSSDPQVARVDRHGLVTVTGEGPVEIIAEVDGTEGRYAQTVTPLPEGALELDADHESAYTGDVVFFEPRLVSEGGGAAADAVDELPIRWSYTYTPHDSIVAPGAAAQVDGGEFMAQFPGTYTVWAQAGHLTAFRSVEIESRQVVRRIEVLGQGRVSHRRTSDFWVFEGVDGRDYAVTGTWGSDGFSYFWDVTDPENMILTDSIQVDARTVNDVKVSPDGRYATLTREGASDRRNGVVILDMAEPAHPVIAIEFDEGLTGGVHNAYPQDDYLYVLSGGERYLIVDMSDIYAPRTVSEVDIPGSRIHDVWVHDGIAYSAEWRTGIVQVDVGNGRWGGSPENPVVVNSYPLPGGNTHAIFPYYQEDTGRFYIFAGDEVIGRRGFALEGGMNRAPYDPDVPGSGTPRNTAGYIHIVDYTDPENPQKVARYHVPEYGTHNIWVEDDILYQAYYEGGLRVVDVSGDLRGNLYTQGREIAVFKPNDPIGYVSNAPTTWSAMPYKGNIFLSDANSGLWSVRLLPEAGLIP
ncbi:MAG: hypothetical protein EA351_08985 [Gemmatimonadales bacterium]|nr:MAG: hypothetical protein EA351_08985 [Gemmatimonadales bacterium]